MRAAWQTARKAGRTSDNRLACLATPVLKSRSMAHVQHRHARVQPALQLQCPALPRCARQGMLSGHPAAERAGHCGQRQPGHSLNSAHLQLPLRLVQLRLALPPLLCWQSSPGRGIRLQPLRLLHLGT